MGKGEVAGTSLLCFLLSSPLCFVCVPLSPPLSPLAILFSLLFIPACRALAPGMASSSGLPPGLPRPKSSKKSSSGSHNSSSSPSPSFFASAASSIVSPTLERAVDAPLVTSLVSGLFPSSFSTPHGLQPVEAVLSADSLRQQPPFVDNTLVTNLGTFPAPLPSDPWHIAHSHVCGHASTACAACSVAFVCCSCRSLRFTPGTAPTSTTPAPKQRSRSVSPLPPQRSHSISPTLFRLDVGNGTPPPGFDSHCNDYDDDAYTRALAEADTCDNSSCPRGADEPATYSITVEQFDEGSEETYERIFRACSACNRSCRKNFMGHRIKARIFDNSAREALATRTTEPNPPAKAPAPAPIPGSAAYACEHPVYEAAPIDNSDNEHGDKPSKASTAMPRTSLTTVSMLQDALLMLSGRPPTPAAFVAIVRVKHDTMCSHPVSSCSICSLGLVCCSCDRLFTPAIARHLACMQCEHVAFSCCDSASCCKCGKLWMPSDSVLPLATPWGSGLRHRRHF